MEKTVRAMFASMTDMKKAAETLKRQGVIDVRIDGQSGSTLPDIVEFAAEPFAAALDSNANYALWVSVEKSRYRQAEDTIAACGGSIEPSVNIF